MGYEGSVFFCANPSFLLFCLINISRSSHVLVIINILLLFLIQKNLTDFAEGKKMARLDAYEL